MAKEVNLKYSSNIAVNNTKETVTITVNGEVPVSVEVNGQKFTRYIECKCGVRLTVSMAQGTAEVASGINGSNRTMTITAATPYFATTYDVGADATIELVVFSVPIGVIEPSLWNNHVTANALNTAYIISKASTHRTKTGGEWYLGWAGEAVLLAWRIKFANGETVDVTSTSYLDPQRLTAPSYVYGKTSSTSTLGLTDEIYKSF